MNKAILIIALIVFTFSSFYQQNEYLITPDGTKAGGKTNNDIQRWKVNRFSEGVRPMLILFKGL